jgi:hypothetical protein
VGALLPGGRTSRRRAGPGVVAATGIGELFGYSRVAVVTAGSVVDGTVVVGAGAVAVPKDPRPVAATPRAAAGRPTRRQAEAITANYSWRVVG